MATSSSTSKTFADVVNAVSSSFLKSRPSHPRQSAEPQNALQRQQSPLHQSIHLPTARWETAPWTGPNFPQLNYEQIENLWPGDTAEDEFTRKCVVKAVEELELNWNLDPCLLGERSEGCRGSAAIVSLLSRLSVASSASKGTQRQGGEIAPGDTDFGEGDRGDGDTKTDSTAAGTSQKPVKSYERHDLLRAIERQDHETILAIRNFNFDLLLDSAPGTTPGASAGSSSSGASSSSSMQTPLGYAISLGPKWEGTAIVLTGALSKFVNSLPDPEDVEDHQTASIRNSDSVPPSKKTVARRRRKFQDELDPRTMARLRKLRGNLKLAVDHSVATDQTRLLASYIQVLFMSEGLSFIHSSVDSLQRSLRSSSGTDPVAEARESVMYFVNAGLKRSKSTDGGSMGKAVGNRKSSSGYSVDVASVQDLVDNAVLDLLLMALWELIKLTNSDLERRQAAKSDVDEDTLALTHPLPAYFFARDDRVSSAFCQRLESLQRYLATETSSSSNSVTRSVDWKRARDIVERLTTSSKAPRRLESKERLQVVQEALQRHKRHP